MSDEPKLSIPLDEGIDPTDGDALCHDVTILVAHQAQLECRCPDDVRRAKAKGRLVPEEDFCLPCLGRDALNHVRRVAERA